MSEMCNKLKLNLFLFDLKSAALNYFYIKTVEKNAGKKPVLLNTDLNSVDKEIEIESLIEKYKDYPSIQIIKEKISHHMVFALQNASVWDILRILLTLNTSKGAGSDTLPPEIINLAAPIIADPLTKIINLLNENSAYPDLLKIASVVPAFKKGEHPDKENYSGLLAS